MIPWYWLLLIGGLATSLAEFFFKYNLIDLLKDKIVGFFSKAESAVQAKESAIKAEVKAEISKFKPKAKK